MFYAGSDAVDRTELIRLIRELQRQNEQLREQIEELQRKSHRSAAPFSKGKRKENPKSPEESQAKENSSAVPSRRPTPATHRLMCPSSGSGVHSAEDDWGASGSKMHP